MLTVWLPSEALRASTAHLRLSWQMLSLWLRPLLVAPASLVASVLVLHLIQFNIFFLLISVLYCSMTNFFYTGNKNGLLLPHTTTDQGFFLLLFSLSFVFLRMVLFALRLIDLPLLFEFEELQHLRNSLPDQVVVQRIEERLSALGNCITCNDHVALTHPDLDRVISLYSLKVAILVITCCILSPAKFIEAPKPRVTSCPHPANPFIHQILLNQVFLSKCYVLISCRFFKFIF